jgi:2-keto-4-pentenoate hydratase
MPTTAELGTIARRMQAAQDDWVAHGFEIVQSHFVGWKVRQIELLTSQFPEFDVPSGYAVADLIHRARVYQGAVPIGRKIGFTPHVGHIRSPRTDLGIRLRHHGC